MMRSILIALISLTVLTACESVRDKLNNTILENEKKLFTDSLRQLDQMLADKQVSLYGEYAEKYPADSLTPLYLFKGADLANGIGRAPDAIRMLETIQQKYPNHQKSGASLFMQAFIYETAIRDNQKAIVKYSEFLKKYPDHNLAPAANFSLRQLQQGLSTEDVVKMFEARNDSLAKLQKENN